MQRCLSQFLKRVSERITALYCQRLKYTVPDVLSLTRESSFFQTLAFNPTTTLSNAISNNNTSALLLSPLVTSLFHMNYAA